MHGWSGWGMGFGMMLTWLVIALGAIWAGMMSAPGGWRSRDSARQVLRERYARGEIDGETLQRMLEELGNQREPTGRAL